MGIIAGFFGVAGVIGFFAGRAWGGGWWIFLGLVIALSGGGLFYTIEYGDSDAGLSAMYLLILAWGPAVAAAVVGSAIGHVVRHNRVASPPPVPTDGGRS